MLSPPPFSRSSLALGFAQSWNASHRGNTHAARSYATEAAKGQVGTVKTVIGAYCWPCRPFFPLANSTAETPSLKFSIGTVSSVPGRFAIKLQQNAGAVVDCQFEGEDVPAILNALEVQDFQGGRLVLEGAWYQGCLSSNEILTSMPIHSRHALGREHCPMHCYGRYAIRSLAAISSSKLRSARRHQVPRVSFEEPRSSTLATQS